MNKENIITYVGLACLGLSILGQFVFNWSAIICSLLAGVFLLSLFKISLSASKKKEKNEEERQKRIKSLGR